MIGTSGASARMTFTARSDASGSLRTSDNCRGVRYAGGLERLGRRHIRIVDVHASRERVADGRAVQLEHDVRNRQLGERLRDELSAHAVAENHDVIAQRVAHPVERPGRAAGPPRQPHGDTRAQSRSASASAPS